MPPEVGAWHAQQALGSGHKGYIRSRKAEWKRTKVEPLTHVRHLEIKPLQAPRDIGTPAETMMVNPTVQGDKLQRGLSPGFRI